MHVVDNIQFMKLNPELHIFCNIVILTTHASTRTTQLYDRCADEVTLDEVERVLI